MISIMKSLVAIKPSYTTDGVVTYGTAGWSRMLDEKHVGDGPNSCLLYTSDAADE